ncbi:MAG: Crp/Fnr family transcriptional regulator [Anaerolineae bacterium]|jgi:CRP/FNR family transcriptional regulator|nr:Crp/Fnr family transcriptional regulator [Anaerolineae bacterium]
MLTTKPMSTLNVSRPSDSRHLARIRDALSHVRHFADLAPAIRDAIARAAAPCHFDAGQVIYLEGEPAEALFILERGWVKATRMSPEGREQALLFLRPGEVFGDVAVFTDTPYPGTVVALEPVDAWVVEKPVILALVAQHPELAMAVIRRLGERVLHYVGMVEDLSLRSVEARLSSTLLKHAGMSCGRLVVPRQTWTTFDEMATRLGTVRDVLSRALKTLEDEGLLRVERHEITILDPAGLAARGNS